MDKENRVVHVWHENSELSNIISDSAFWEGGGQIVIPSRKVHICTWQTNPQQIRYGRGHCVEFHWAQTVSTLPQTGLQMRPDNGIKLHSCFTHGLFNITGLPGRAGVFVRHDLIGHWAIPLFGFAQEDVWRITRNLAWRFLSLQAMKSNGIEQLYGFYFGKRVFFFSFFLFIPTLHPDGCPFAQCGLTLVHWPRNSISVAAVGLMLLTPFLKQAYLRPRISHLCCELTIFWFEAMLLNICMKMYENTMGNRQKSATKLSLLCSLFSFFFF